MITDWLYELCRGTVSVTSELAKDPHGCPGDVADKLFTAAHRKSHKKHIDDVQDESYSDDLCRARECGDWGASRPSDLFLRIYHDALGTLESDPMVGITSPPLMGSHGVIPLTVIGTVPDICRHISNCIARAEKEVVLATSYWMHSNNATLITNAMRELSVRAGKRGEKVVMKVMFDRANTSHILHSHQPVTPDEAVSPNVKLPERNEIPHIDLQVVNYHRAWLGTLHSKLMIVDRRLGLLESNNIQDTDNLEMMVRFEGPIVDSLYDMALITWRIALDPPLPLMDTPAGAEAHPTYAPQDLEMPTQVKESTGQAARAEHPAGISEDNQLAEHTHESPHYDPDTPAEIRRINASINPRGSETRRDSVTRHLNIISRPDITGDAPEWPTEDHMKPYILHAPHEPFPMALVCREPYGAISHSSTDTPQNAAFLAAINNAQHSIFIQTPDLNAEPLLEPLLDAARRGVVVTCYLCLGYNDAGQLLPFQNGTNEMTCNRLYNSLSSDEEKGCLRMYNYVGKDQTKPIHNKFKLRSCHIKLMIIDESVGIQGSGNLDTQSFYHSQETNVLLDSPQICREWLDALRRNQNTARYGAVSTEDGCWHDPETGEMAVGSIGVDPGRFSWAKGIAGAVNRIRGLRGF